MLHEESLEMMGCLALHLREDLPGGHGPTSALWAPHLQEMVDRVFCFYEMLKASTKSRAKSGVFLGSQSLWRHFHEAALGTKSYLHSARP